MKINVFGTRGFPLIQGGVEKHCECLYPLMGEDYMITVFRRKPYVRSYEEYPRIRFIDLPSTQTKGFEALFHSLLATIYSLWHRSDVVHIHNIGPAIFSPLLKLAGIKVVLTYHSPNYEHAKWNTTARMFLKLSEKIALRVSDRIIFVNKFQLNKYRQNVQAKSCYIPNGTNAPEMTADTDYIDSLQLEKGKYILAVGRITPEKGFDYLIKAFEKASAGKDYKLVIAGGVEGEQTYFANLKKSATTGNILFTGYVFGYKLAQLYINAALFVLPSYNEGFPIVLLEAMNYGLNILASDIPANKITKLPENSYFKTGNEMELSERLQQFIQQKQYPSNIKYEGMGEYKWDIIALKTMEVYEKAMGIADSKKV